MLLWTAQLDRGLLDSVVVEVVQVELLVIFLEQVAVLLGEALYVRDDFVDWVGWLSVGVLSQTEVDVFFTVDLAHCRLIISSFSIITKFK